MVDLDTVEQIFGFVSLNSQEYWLVFPTGDAFIYHYVYQTWSRDTFGDFTAGYEVLDSATALTWDTISSTWETTGGSWGSYEATGFPRIFAGRSDGKTFFIDNSIAYDYFTVGSIVSRNLETFDIYFPSGKYQGDELSDGDMWEEGTIQRVMLVYEADKTNTEPFVVGVSFDKGSTWIEQTVTPGPEGFVITDFNITGRLVRFRFRENNANGRFRWSSFGYEFIPAGPTSP